MFVHFLTIAFRNMWRNKTQSLIGVFGLAFGIVCFVPAYFWLRYETGYDGFYPDAGHIYRIYAVEKQSGKVNERVPEILESKLHEHFPVTENSIGFNIWYETYSIEEKPHVTLRTLNADSAFFRIFPQTFVSGDAHRPLLTERNIVITETVAVRLFGDIENAIGRQLKSTQYFFPPYTVSAVVKDPPRDTNLSFEVIHFPEIQKQALANRSEEARWRFFDKEMYVKLAAQTDVEVLAGQLLDFTSQLGVNTGIELRMVPIAGVRHRLNPDLPFTTGFIRLFVAAGLLLLCSAFFNFLNLSLGLFRQRIHELSRRMVAGATTGQVILQMLVELSCVTLLALALAFGLVVAVRPALGDLLDISVAMNRLTSLFMLCGVSVTGLMLLSATFPLWRLSRMALHQTSKKITAGQPALRRLAVSMQLAVSIVFIVSACVVMMQLRFVNRKDLGFDRHGVIQLTGTQGVTGDDKWAALMRELETFPQTESIASSDFELQHDVHRLNTEVAWTGKTSREKPGFQVIGADHRFAGLFRLTMKQGRWWDEGEHHKVVLNEEAVRVMGLHDPVGAVVGLYPEFIRVDGSTPMREYEVAGVVSDFHTLSLRSPIYPAIIKAGDGFFDRMRYIRVVPGQEREVMKRITGFLAEIDVPPSNIGLTPLDALYNRLNHPEQTGLKIFAVLAAVCLLVSLFGIYAVATASTRRRRREIAIRKVVGAEVRDIVRIFFREHTLQAIIAGVVALPVAYLAMNRWLQGYAYHTTIPWWLPAGVLIAVVAVVLLTVFGQIVKAAGQNPAEVVKGE